MYEKHNDIKNLANNLHHQNMIKSIPFLSDFDKETLKEDAFFAYVCKSGYVDLVEYVTENIDLFTPTNLRELNEQKLIYVGLSAAINESKNDIVNFLSSKLIDKEFLEKSLLRACYNNNFSALKSISKHTTNEQNSKALLRASASNQIDIVKFLIEKSNPRYNNSGALVSALLNENQEVAILLYPHSNIRDAVKTLKYNYSEHTYKDAINFLNIVKTHHIDKAFLKENINKSSIFQIKRKI